LSFILTCKDESHPWIVEQVKWGIPETLETAFRTGRNHLEYRYKGTNGLENRANGEKLTVNYLYFGIYNRKKDKITYKTSWITDKTITKENVKLLAECGRAHWKIENENNNVLKNCGYHLEHNFGHGKNHSREVYCVLNQPAFPVHVLMILCDEDFIKACGYFGRRYKFYNAPRTFFRAFEFQTWEYLLLSVIAQTRGG
jgi:hypothetical protein